MLSFLDDGPGTYNTVAQADDVPALDHDGGIHVSTSCSKIAANNRRGRCSFFFLAACSCSCGCKLSRQRLIATASKTLCSCSHSIRRSIYAYTLICAVNPLLLNNTVVICRPGSATVNDDHGFFGEERCVNYIPLFVFFNANWNTQACFLLRKSPSLSSKKTSFHLC